MKILLARDLSMSNGEKDVERVLKPWQRVLRPYIEGSVESVLSIYRLGFVTHRV